MPSLPYPHVCKSIRVLLGCLMLLLACKPSVRQAAQRTNQQESLAKPYVVLVSIDGFRHDYVQQHELKQFKQIAAEGVAATAMVPAFPSKTFPNHYTIATGLYPEHHGIVANTFYDPEKGQTYRIRDREKVEDGSWYGGTPLWVLAEQQGMLAASFFWVGSEADVQGVRPTYYYRYDQSIPNETRVDQVIDWLKMEESQRPHLITLYFSDIDSKGHDFGPGSPELAEALEGMDRLIADLDQKLQALDLPVNLIVTSDHGMTLVDQKHPIRLNEMIKLDDFQPAPNGAMYMLYAQDQQKIETAYHQLLPLADRFDVYKKEDIPDYLHFRASNRIGDLLLIAHPPYIITDRPGIFPRSKGEHGYDPHEVEDMHTIFYAKGPAFKKGMLVPAFENIHLYPLIAHILQLTPPPTDGRLEVLKPVLAEENE